MKMCNYSECRIVGACTVIGGYKPPCSTETCGTQPTAPNSAMDAIALLKEAVDAFTHGDVALWFGENGKRINAVVAQQRHA